MTRRNFLTYGCFALGMAIAAVANWGWVESARADDDAFRVMSFNIRCIANDGENHWDLRRETLLAEILDTDPLLLGVQEATAPQMDYLAENLTAYDFIGVGRDDGEQAGEFCAVFYKKADLTVLDSGTFWLSETPDEVGSRGWDAMCNRVVTWGKFQRKNSDRPFMFANTHFDHRGQKAQKESAKLLITRAAEWTDGGKIPLILLGDFNVTRQSDAYKTLTGGDEPYPGLIDSALIAVERVEPVAHTFSGFGSIAADKGNIIDFIFVNEQVAAERFEINPDLREGRAPSDHNSIFATLRLK